MTDLRDRKVHKYIPPGILPEGKEEPTTVLEAVRIGRAILAEEGRWTKRKAYEILHPEEDPSTPFCDSWMVCSVGALEVALVGMVEAQPTDCECCSSSRWEPLASNEDPEARHLYDLAVRELNRTTGEHIGIVVLNDKQSTTLEDVLKVWDDTIARLEVAEGTKQ